MKPTVMIPPPVVWIHGLSASGKSTLSTLLYQYLLQQFGEEVVLIDGEQVRGQLSRTFGYSAAERVAVHREVLELVKNHQRQQKLVVVATITHLRDCIELARNELDPFFEVFLDCPVSLCAERDFKDQYSKAYAGELVPFIGVHEEYEMPEDPDLQLQTGVQTPEESFNALLMELQGRYKFL